MKYKLYQNKNWLINRLENRDKLSFLINIIKSANDKKTHQIMFQNTYQSGFLSILYSIGSKPLQIWDNQVVF